MEISHHGVRAELPDEWWLAARMSNFVRAESAYRCDHAAAGGRRVCLIPIMDIGPIRRTPGVPVFSSRERVERILRAFVANGALPPVELTKQAGFFYLKDGLHRVYCSIAAGFTEIPAIKFIDLEALDAGRNIEELC
jgi:hypothetical protein